MQLVNIITRGLLDCVRTASSDNIEQQRVLTALAETNFGLPQSDGRELLRVALDLPMCFWQQSQTCYI